MMIDDAVLAPPAYNREATARTSLSPPSSLRMALMSERPNDFE
jgi:hypothetical protein